MQDYRMLLYPVPFAAEPVADERLLAALIGCRLVAADSSMREFRLEGVAAGDEFLSLVTFLGCAPSARLTSDAPGAEGDLNRIRLIGGMPTARLLSTRHSLRRPRCPGCRASFDPIPDASGSVSSMIVCRQCGESTPLAGLEWRHSAAFARQAIEIHGVFEGEAVPSERLLELLHILSGFRWDYAYCCDP
jgi:hypothetical protein